ncbi:CheY-like superfamily [Penicillium nucicola]|uniref:CheY-like superfamily n=1 Tax=Penicillium nucicola TaxID=1850975 RepID=UPI002544FB83|nr:CheY-like superfamily [Penicillium nucicola]KAJ5762319.1 CheY-like superfamily [Penicillium nucicola]
MASPGLEGDRRARELYHYFQPDNPALLPTDQCATRSLDKVSPNLVLTALSQLAAIKLGAQRAIISLIDRETLYVAAEASQSLNLGRNDVYDDDGDGLWMGCGHGPVAGTLCEEQDQERKLANIRAMSEPEHGALHAAPAPQIELHFARRMLQRYRRGGLWYFHQDGTALSSEEDTTSAESPRDALDPSQPLLSAHPQSTGSLREKDLQALRQYFPKATRIIFVPLWDSLNSRWFGGCFGWSCLENRVFSAHVELGGLFGLGSSLMVEYSRIQSQESNKQKDDFISTISHELRSPLHGILAANEFLAEYVESEFAKRLLDTIRACGQTLLDTFEQILDFTKINSFESKRSRYGPDSHRLQAGGKENLKLQPLRILKLVDVVAIIEDVIESVYSGHILSNSLMNSSREPGKWSLGSTAYRDGTADAPSKAKIDVSIDATPRDWEFVLESGALRRIVMNVVGNALKYTQEGSVSVRIEIQRKVKGIHRQILSDSVGSPVLVLTVSDTGRGISDEYLRSKIFTPFSQEDTLSPGTGLGLALVRDILRSLGGNISMKSKLGTGTTVKMTFPLTEPQPHELVEAHSSISDPSPRPSDLIKRVRTDLEGKALHFITPRGSLSNMPPSNHMVRHYLTEWFGMNIVNRESTRSADIVVVDENHLDLVDMTQLESLLLVLYHRASRARSEMVTANKLPSNTIWLSLPCGPHQLARTLLNSDKNISSIPNLGLNEISHSALAARLKSSQIPRQMVPPAEEMKRLDLAKVTVRPVPDLETDTRKAEELQTLTLTPTHSLPSTKTAHAAKIEHGITHTHIFPKNEIDHGIKILLVDDNAINLALLEKYISRTKPRLLNTAINGDEAIQAVQEMTSGYQYIFMGKFRLYSMRSHSYILLT